jgi:hypothetical protein
LGRVVGLLLAALLVGIALQAWIGSDLRELEALGEAGDPAALERARRIFRLVMAATFASSFGFGAALAWLSLRVLRTGRFPPSGAAWIGARRDYAGGPARAIGALGLLLSAVMLLVSGAGVALAWLR